MIETKTMDMTDPEQVTEVLTAYYNLYRSDLQCIEQKTTPELEHLTRPDVIVVMAYESGEPVGVMMVDNDAVLFPALGGDRVETLKALCVEAYEANDHYIESRTDNQLICDLALSMGLPEVKSEGNFIWWGDKANQIASPWGAGR